MDYRRYIRDRVQNHYQTSAFCRNDSVVPARQIPIQDNTHRFEEICMVGTVSVKVKLPPSPPPPGKSVGVTHGNSAIISVCVADLT